MPDGHWVYVEAPDAHPRTRHTHLVAFDALGMIVVGGEVVHPKTICGIATTNGWEWGDETLSAVAATCGRCLRIARPDRPELRRT